MCEPNMSTVQFPPDQQGPKTDALKRFFDFGKKILGWLHFCKMGKGHSGAIQETSENHLWLPDHNDYETMWWDRVTKRDGHYSGKDYDATISLEAATEYGNAVCCGSPTALRRFLETSVKKTDRPEQYYIRFVEGFLNPLGRSEFQKKLKSVFGIRKIDLGSLFGRNLLRDIRVSHIEKVLSVMLAFTRKRKLLVSAWSDDSTIWSSPMNDSLSKVIVPDNRIILPGPVS